MNPILSPQLRLRAAFAALALSLICLGLGAPAGARAQAQPPALVYARLEGKRKTLFDEWARQKNTRERASLAPAERFAALSVSQRTTFVAVTHALTRSRLTGGSGAVAGSAIDLIESLEEIAGQEPGKGGDQEFRLYVRLIPGAVRRLEASREFQRGKDNSIFHAGYPINYRQDGKSPTIQFSITKEENRADIDVDYRSSHFPVALFNGHLTAANSDVRPQNNFRGHISRWQGLLDWWDKQVSQSDGDPAAGTPGKRTDYLPLEGHADAPEAKAVAATVDKFLNAWLIKRNTDAAMKFASGNVAVCFSVDADLQAERLGEKQSLRVFRNALESTNSELGRPRTLGEAVAAVEPHDTGLKLVDHRERNAYALASITDNHFEHFLCNAKSSPATSADAQAGPHGEHYLSLFRFKLPNNEEGGGMILLWTKEGSEWKLSSFDVLSH